MILRGCINNTNKVTEVHEDSMGNVIGICGDKIVLLDSFNNAWFDTVTGQYVTAT